jgi:hypothetical protein
MRRTSTVRPEQRSTPHGHIPGHEERWGWDCYTTWRPEPGQAGVYKQWLCCRDAQGVNQCYSIALSAGPGGKGGAPLAPKAAARAAVKAGYKLGAMATAGMGARPVERKFPRPVPPVGDCQARCDWWCKMLTGGPKGWAYCYSKCKPACDSVATPGGGNGGPTPRRPTGHLTLKPRRAGLSVSGIG